MAIVASRPRLRADLENRFNGPIPAHLLAQAAAEESAFRSLSLRLQQAALIIDAAKMVASYRKIALELLAERREAWAFIRDGGPRSLAEHQRLLWQFEQGISHEARQWVRRYRAAKQLLAKFRDELAAMPLAAVMPVEEFERTRT